MDSYPSHYLTHTGGEGEDTCRLGEQLSRLLVTQSNPIHSTPTLLPVFSTLPADMRLCFGGSNPGAASPLWLSDFWPLCELHVQAAPPLEVRVGAFDKKILRHPSVFSTVNNLRLAHDNRINHTILTLPGAGTVIEKGNTFARMFCNGGSIGGGGGGGETRPEWLHEFAGFDGFLLSSAVEVHPCDYLDNGQPCAITDMPNVMASVVVMHSIVFTLLSSLL